MNGPKVVAQVLVVAIIVGCCYGMFTTAIPTEYPPVEISSNGDATVEQHGMAIKITTPEFTVDSKMPSDLKDVYIDLALDADGLRYNLGRIPIGTIAAKDSTTISATELDTIPAYIILASLACNSKDGQITTPILAKLHFSYLEFQKESFIDLGLNLRINMSIEGGVTVEKDGNNATMTIDVPETGLTKDIVDKAKTICDSSGNCPITIEGCDASFNLNISDDGTVEFRANGNEEKTAFELMDSFINEFFKDDSNTEITMNYGNDDDSLTITKEQAKSFENMIKAFYGAAA